MNAENHVGRPKNQFVVTLVDKYAVRVEHGAHRPVEHDHLRGIEQAEELRCARADRKPLHLLLLIMSRRR